MAVTKIHPIKSTLKKALDYIENPDKTDEKLFVSSYGCSYETADIEFQMLLDQAYQKGNNLAHHLIQAFEPGETTAEQAHEIGRQLADEVLQGKYPYVITTHIDKGHLHNHIIFCAVDMLAFAEYERGMIVERTQTGKAVARQDPSFKDGRPKKFTPEQIQLALDLLEQGKTYRQITTMTGISKSTLIRAKQHESTI